MEKVILTTTLNQLKEKSACREGYEKLVKHLGGVSYDHDAPINLLSILDSNGVDDMLWSLRAVVHPDVERIARYIACDCADLSLATYEKYAPTDNRPRLAVEAARKFADGVTTPEELSAAWSAAR